MDDNSIIRQIKRKGNGQAIIYITKKEMQDHNLDFDDYVKIDKVLRTVKIKEVNKK